MKLLFVTAHLHYAMCYCAGTVANHVKNGDEVYVLSLTHGELMTDRYSIDELKRINIAEAQEAAGLLGIKEVNVLDFKDTDITNRHEIVLAISDEIRRVKPEIVITHLPKDTHPDFRETSKAVIDAAFFAILVQGDWCHKYPPHFVSKVFGFELPMLSVDFKDDVHIDISDMMDIKRKSMECFKAHILANCKNDPDIWVTSATGANRRWGMECGVMYAEAYQKLKVHEIHCEARKTLQDKNHECKL